MGIAGGLVLGVRHTTGLVHEFCQDVKPGEPFEHVHARGNGAGLEFIDGAQVPGDRITLFRRKFPGIVANCQVTHGPRGVVGARYWAD